MIGRKTRGAVTAPLFEQRERPLWPPVWAVTKGLHFITFYRHFRLQHLFVLFTLFCKTLLMGRVVFYRGHILWGGGGLYFIGGSISHRVLQSRFLPDLHLRTRQQLLR